MEQGSRLDSRPVSPTQEAPRHTVDNQAADEAVARLLAEPPAAVGAELPPIVLTPAESCPAFRTGAQIGRLTAHHYDLDVSQEPETEKGERHREMDRTQSKLDLLADAMTFHIATSTSGALAQIVVGIQFMRETMEREDLSQEQVWTLLEKTQRCLFSVAGVLAAQSGMSARMFGSDYTLPAHLDHLRLAYAPVDWKRSIGPKPTVDDFPQAAGGEIERLTEEYWANLQFYDEACDARDSAAEEGRSEDKKRGELCVAHAVRMLHQCLRILAGTPAVTLRDFALKACVVASECDEWWGTDQLDQGALVCRQMVDQIMAAAGVRRRPRRDFTREHLAQSLLTPSRGSAGVPA